MVITPIKTERVSAGGSTLFALLDRHVTEMSENSVLAITSKIVSLCENNVVSIAEGDKDELIHQQATHYLPPSSSRYGFQFTITQGRLIPTAGIDESNGDNVFILWPKDAQKTANDVRHYLAERFKLQNVGVIITDSTCMPLTRGTGGIVLAHSGFSALNNYIGKPDLFGRPFAVSQSNVTSGLAASAVVVMGEGSEQTPLALISDVPFVSFQQRNPTAAELAELRIGKDEDLFAPFLESVQWLDGKAAEL